MGSPATLSSEAERESSLICVHEAEVYDVNYEGSAWVVASSLASSSSSSSSVQEEADASSSLASHIHSELIVAAPVHEASNFLERKVLDKALGRGRYKDFVKERISACFEFETSLDLPFGFCAMTYKGAPATVAICETSRRAAGSAGEDADGGLSSSADGSGDTAETWIVQSDTKWARTALDEDWAPLAMREALLEAFATALGRSVSELPKLCSSSSSGSEEEEAAADLVAVWPYGDMDYSIDGGCAWVDELRLALAGDWAYNGRVEGAWLSGRAAAERVLDARRKQRAEE